MNAPMVIARAFGRCFKLGVFGCCATHPAHESTLPRLASAAGNASRVIHVGELLGVVSGAQT